MKALNTPSPSRLRLDTSPLEGVEDGWEPFMPGPFPRPLQGERWSAKQTGEGAAMRSASR
ncbi:MAG: hypothetical protein BGN87_16780 [Rhizobiales bacterium 65-79]|jgi:hypothetical protein|nr:MAG: hypothetical protein BGN87_16780 [Rhizobiales bacterium 65-79]